jgi:hypothetical protein
LGRLPHDVSQGSISFQKGNAGLRFSFGGNLADEDERFAPNDFYKLSFFLSL